MSPGCKGGAERGASPKKSGAGAEGALDRATGPFDDKLFDALPEARGERLFEAPPVIITQKALTLHGRILLRLTGGKVAPSDLAVEHGVTHMKGILPVLKKEAEAQKKPRKNGATRGASALPTQGCLLIAAERQVPFRTVNLLLETASLAGFKCFQAAVRQRTRSSARKSGAPALQAVGVPFSLVPIFTQDWGPMQSYVKDGCSRDRSVYVDDPEEKALRGRHAGGFGIGSHRKTGPKVHLSTLNVSGGLDGATVTRVIKRRLDTVRYCYVTKGLPSKPRLAGLLKISFTVTPSGLVGQAAVAADTLMHRALQTCVLAALRRWRFPKPEGSMPFVTVRFYFKPPSPGRP